MTRAALFLLSLAFGLSACVAPRPAAPPPTPAPAPPPPATAYTPPSEPVEVRADAGPQPFQIRPVIPAPVTSAARLYRVVKGDTLRGISDKTNASSEAIARANRLAPPFVVKLGQKLRIPAGRWHVVRAGQTGIAIARAYGVDWSRIATINQLAEPYILRTGQRLELPSASEVASMSIEQRAAAFRLDIDDLITGAQPALAANAEPVKPSPARPRDVPPSTPVAPASAFDGRFAWPLEGRILRRFGAYGSGLRSEGINIEATAAAPVLASADGVVIYAGTDLPAYGGLILIRHSDAWTTAYGYAAELLVKRGEAVKRGQIIARAGDTGAPGEARLHFEIRQGRKPVDPLLYLRNKI